MEPGAWRIGYAAHDEGNEICRFETHTDVHTEFLSGEFSVRVNSTQSLILTAPADRLHARSNAGSGAQQANGTGLGAEPLDVTWTEVDGADGLAGDTGLNLGFPVQQQSAGNASRSPGAWSPVQQYALQAAVTSAAKGLYLDVHA
jgi:hypothetical protein